MVRVRHQGNEKFVDLISDDYKSTVAVDSILVGIGRRPNVENMNLEAAGVKYDLDSGVRVNDFLQTTNSRIYASGDVCLEHKFMHIEDASARLVVRKRCGRSIACRIVFVPYNSELFTAKTPRLQSAKTKKNGRIFSCVRFL